MTCSINSPFQFPSVGQYVCCLEGPCIDAITTKWGRILSGSCTGVIMSYT